MAQLAVPFSLKLFLHLASRIHISGFGPVFLAVPLQQLLSLTSKPGPPPLHLLSVTLSQPLAFNSIYVNDV